MLHLLPGFPEDVLAVSAAGEVTGEDYRQILVPATAARLKTQNPLRLFFHLGLEFSGMRAGAMWEDAKLGFGNWNDWGRFAVVTDVAWIADAARLFAPFFHHPLKVFANADYEVARRWISERDY
jgi:hypothetical protein